MRHLPGGMSVSHRYDPELRTLFYEFCGEVREAELLEIAGKLASDPSIPPGRRELVDLSRLETTDVTAGALRRVAQIYADADERPEDSPVAIVAPGDLFFGLSRMYEAYRQDSPVRIRIFRSLAEARAWLGLEA
jgi:hypothetical protein